jgi:O-antigen ligase
MGVLIGWRMTAAARVSDWQSWLARYQQAPGWLHVAAWLALIGIYYLATFPPLIGLCWLAAALLCLAQPQVGLWLAVALIPFYFQHKEVQLVDAVLTVPPSHLLAFALLPAVYLRRQASGVRRQALGVAPRPSSLAPRPFHWWELTPLLLLPLSLLAMVNVWHWPAFVRGTLDLVIVPLLLWLAVRTLAVADDERQRVLAALFAGGVLAALVGLSAWFGGHGAEVDGVRRLVGPHFSANHTALYLERSLLLGLALVITLRRRSGIALRVVTWSTVLLVAVALVLTGSRGALLLGAPAGLAVLISFALARRPARRRWLRQRRYRIGLVVAAVGILVVLVMLWQQARLANLETVVLRLEVWRAALALWRDHFWAGVGPGGFFWRYPAYLPVGAVEVEQLHPHNVWLEVTTTWGVLGLAWLVLSGVALIKALEAQRRASRVSVWIAVGATAGLAAGLAHAQTDAFLLLADLAAWNAVAWALATAPGEDAQPAWSRAGSDA